MKIFSNTPVCMLIAFLFFIQDASAQKMIIIEDTSNQRVIKNFNNEQEPITQSDIKENDIQIKFDKDFMPISLQRVMEGKAKPPLKEFAKKEEGFIIYLIEKESKYEDDAIELLLKMKDPKKNNKEKLFVFKIITIKGKPDPETTGSGLSACKIKKLKKIDDYIFIPDSLMFKLANNPCGGSVCKDCEPDNNIIQYDFKTNKTIKKFPKTFKKSDDTGSKHPNVGGPVEFIIRNVNPYLYDVTISDTTVNHNMDASGTYLGLLLGQNLPDDNTTGAENFDGGDNTCILNDTDLLRKAVEDLYSQLGRFYDELLQSSPYTDASCFGELIRKVKLSINDTLRKKFSNAPLHINNYNTLRGFMKKNKDIFTDEIIAELDSAYTKIETRHHVYAYKVPEIDNVDEIHFRFNIVPKNKDLALPVVNKGVIKSYTKGGFKIDVSSGLYYGFMNNDEWNLRKDSMPLNAGGFQKGNKIYKEETGKGEFGFASFLHFYPRTGGFLNVSGTIGAGLNLSDKPKPRYFGGISLLAGRGTNRLAVNLGIILGNATRISDQYPKDANGNYILLHENETNLITKQKFISNFFISISYNLPFALKKTKIPQTTTAPPAQKSSETPAKTDTTKKENKDAEGDTGSQSFSGEPLKNMSSGKLAPAITQSSSSGAMLKEKTKKKFYKKKS